MSPRSTRLQFVALGFAVATAASAAPDASLLAAARAAEPAVVESLKEMVSIESGTMDLPGLAVFNHHGAFEGGVLAQECGEVLRRFFAERRG